MGRIRGKWIKNTAKQLVEQHPDRFGTNFDENKKVLDEMKIIENKPTKNKIAGYIITVVQKKKFK